MCRRDNRDANKIVTIIDLALNLRRRWHRLSNAEQLSDEEVLRMIHDFWFVDNFCGTGLDN